MLEEGIPIADSIGDITPVQRTVLEYIKEYWTEKAKDQQNTTNNPNNFSI